MELTEFEDLIPPQVDFLEPVAVQTKRYITHNLKGSYEAARAESVWEEEIFLRQRVERLVPIDEQRIARRHAKLSADNKKKSSSKNPYKTIVDEWKRGQGDPTLALATFYYFLRYENLEPSYFLAIAKAVWGVDGEAFRRFYYALKSGDPTETFAEKIARFHSPEAMVKFHDIWVGPDDVAPLPQTPADFLFLPTEITDKDEQKEAWLSARNFESIPLVGRDQEIGILNDFLALDQPFSILPIIAPSGAGKTRLMTEWMLRRADLDGWDKGFLTDRSADVWKRWMPQRNTLIVIDYVFQFDDAIAAIVNVAERLKNKKNQMVRLVIIDHVFPEKLTDLIGHPSLGGLIQDRDQLIDRRKSFFLEAGLTLQSNSEEADMLRLIVEKLAGEGLPADRLDAAMEALHGMGDAAQHPLFAALIGDALARGQTDFASLNRRDLIAYYLNTTNRLLWRNPNVDELSSWAGQGGKWAGAMIAAATARRALPFDEMLDCLPTETTGIGFYERSKTNTDRLSQHCRSVVSSANQDLLPAFEPDIIGEAYFLIFLSEFERNEQVFAVMNEMLQVWLFEPHGQRYIFVDYFVRMTRNLINDDPETFGGQVPWKALLAF